MSDSEQRQGARGGGVEENTTAVVNNSEQKKPDGESTAGAQGSMVPPGTELEIGQVLAGRYIFLHTLGQGGMGLVLAAYDTQLDRRVALKLMRPQGREEEGAQLRLLREAQAMARLAHPNVVAVYDAGRLGDGRVFIAMELVEGQTLRQWCSQERRGWRELLELYVAAGRGLAAAHRAGLVHRDFKPDNVLVGHDGRVRVTDFGVARVEASSSAIPLESLPTEVPRLTESWETPLTVPGTVPGTLKYMAPELLQGRLADGRSDMFAFCLALYEALYGRPPFEGASAQQCFQAKLAGRVLGPPAHSGVPAWVERAVMQGLRLQPQERPASMEVLLAALSRSPAQARTRWLALGTGLVAALGLAVWGVASWHLRLTEHAQLCQGGPQRLAGVWDAEVQARIRQAFLATRRPFAEDSFHRLQQALEAHAAAWVSMHREACEATRLRGEQPEQVLERRMVCLERRLLELEAFSQVLAQADGAVVQQAMQAAHQLPSLQACADLESLLAEVPPPDSPTTRQAVDALRQELARVRALTLGGKLAEAATAATAAVQQARSLDYPPIITEALVLLGSALLRTNPNEALTALTEATWLAHTHHQDSLVVDASTLLIQALATTDAFDKVPWWAAYATAWLTRTRGEAAQAFRLHSALGVSYSRQGKFELALESFRKAHQLAQRAFGPEHFSTVSAEGNIAIMLAKQGRYREAVTSMERVTEHFTKVLGPRHPTVSQSLVNLAYMQSSTGPLSEAQRRLEQALPLLRESMPPSAWPYVWWHANSAFVALGLGRYGEAQTQAVAALDVIENNDRLESGEAAMSHSYLGTALLKQGRHREALVQLKRAVEVSERALSGEARADVAVYQSALAAYYQSQGKYAQALQQYRRGLELLTREGYETDINKGVIMIEMGESLLRAGQPQQALEQARLGHQELTPRLGPHAPVLIESLQVQGEALLALGQASQAVRPLEEALEVAQADGLDPNLSARVRFLLARALHDSQQAPERVRALVSQAHKDYARTAFPKRPQQAELQRWALAQGMSVAAQ